MGKISSSLVAGKRSLSPSLIFPLTKSSFFCFRFYCGQIDHDGKKYFVMNGFYMSMRSKYTAAPAKIQYYLVEWSPSKLSWNDFRGKVLGDTDPVSAGEGSLRRVIYENCK